jgi:hypothetical protein
MTSHKIMPTVFTASSLFSIAITTAILLNNLERFKELLNSENESLSEDERHTLAYSACMGGSSKTFLHCLIFDYKLKEELINPLHLTEEAKSLFAQRNAEELSKELDAKNGKDKGMKI